MGSSKVQEPRAEDPRVEVPLRLTWDRAFQLGAAASFLILLLATEVVARVATRRGWVYDRYDVAGALTSLPELRDRLRWAARGESPLLLLGDSVLGATALLERGEAGAREKTLPRALQELRGGRVVSLAADGLVPLDLYAEAKTLAGALPRRAPGILVVVNFRMLAKDLEAEDKRLSRPFLAAALSASERPGVPPGPFEESELSARLFEMASRRLVLFRTAQLLRTLWYFPTQRDRFQRLVESALGRPPLGDAEEAALRMRVMPFYQEPFREGGPALADLESALGALRRVGEPLVVLSPQNPDVVAEAEESVAKSREVLRAAVHRAGVTRYEDLSDRFPAPLFLDHCHLTAAGNRRFAGELAALLARTPS